MTAEGVLTGAPLSGVHRVKGSPHPHTGHTGQVISNCFQDGHMIMGHSAASRYSTTERLKEKNYFCITIFPDPNRGFQYCETFSKALV